jgi:hypothetical protein
MSAAMGFNGDVGGDELVDLRRFLGQAHKANRLTH